MSLVETIICKNCGHRLYRLSNGELKHFTRFYHDHSMPYHSHECYALTHNKNVFSQRTFCGCRHPEAQNKVLELTMNYKEELELSLQNGVSKSERIFITRMLREINDNLNILEG